MKIKRRQSFFIKNYFPTSTKTITKKYKKHKQIQKTQTNTNKQTQIILNKYNFKQTNTDTNNYKQTQTITNKHKQLQINTNTAADKITEAAPSSFPPRLVSHMTRSANQNEDGRSSPANEIDSPCGRKDRRKDGRMDGRMDGRESG